MRLLKDIPNDAGEQMIKKGWYVDPHECRHGAEAFGCKIAGIALEVSEALEHWRRTARTDVYYVDRKPEGVGIELADVLIQTLNCLSTLGLDATALVEEKLNYNKTRSLKHGGKRF